MQNISRHFRVRDEKNQFTTHALWALILPLVLEQLLSVTIGMADTVMVSRTGDAAVSAVSLVDSINNLLIQLFSALATGGAVVSSQLDGEPFFSGLPGGDVALVIGNEARGVSDEVRALATHRLRLPMPGGAESLNAAVAAGIMIYACIDGRR